MRSLLFVVVLLSSTLCCITAEGFVDYEEATPLIPYGQDGSFLEDGAGETVACPTGACPLANGQCCAGHASCCPGHSSCWVHPVMKKAVCPKRTTTPATSLILQTPAPRRIVMATAQQPEVVHWSKDPEKAASALEKRLEAKFKKMEYHGSQLKGDNESPSNPMIDTAAHVGVKLPGHVDKVIEELKSLSGSNCDDTLGGYMIPDRFKGQPRLNLAKAYKSISHLGKLPGMHFEVVGEEDGYKVELLHMISKHSAARRVIITSGVHGNEPIGVTAQLELISILYESHWRAYFDFTFVPTLNPGGLRDNFRTMRNGMDLNRMFTKKSFPKALKVLEKYVSQHKYALSLDLHGAMKRHGFFVIKGGDDNGLVTKALSALDPKLLQPSDSGEYPGYVSLNGDPRKYLLKHAGEATSSNPGTMKGFMYSLGTPDAYTLEYPGQLPVCTRQAGLVTIATSIIGHYIEARKPFQLNKHLSA